MAHTNEQLLFVEPDEIWLGAFEAFKMACEDLPEVYLPSVPEGKSFIEVLKEQEAGLNLPEGFVPASHRWLVSSVDKKMLGVVNIRHRLNAHLSFRGGHIGYYIKPTERCRGYATEMLKRALVHCKELKIDTVLITCDDTNVASYKTIEANDGQLISKDTDHDGTSFRRYHIEL